MKIKTLIGIVSVLVGCGGVSELDSVSSSLEYQEMKRQIPRILMLGYEKGKKLSKAPCEDTDGKDFYNKGSVTGIVHFPDGSQAIMTEVDQCHPDGDLVEKVCNGVSIGSQKLPCDVGNTCYDGVCTPCGDVPPECTPEEQCGEGCYCLSEEPCDSYFNQLCEEGHINQKPKDCSAGFGCYEEECFCADGDNTPINTGVKDDSFFIKSSTYGLFKGAWQTLEDKCNGKALTEYGCKEDGKEIAVYLRDCPENTTCMEGKCQ